MVTIASLWAIAVVLLVLFLARSVRRKHRRVRCPVLGTDAEVSFFEAAPDGRAIEVTACTAFRPPTNVVCKRRCLELLNRGVTPRESGDRESHSSVPARTETDLLRQIVRAEGRTRECEEIVVSFP